jgi:hypothetical protein
MKSEEAEGALSASQRGDTELARHSFTSAVPISQSRWTGRLVIAVAKMACPSARPSNPIESLLGRVSGFCIL